MGPGKAMMLPNLDTQLPLRAAKSHYTLWSPMVQSPPDVSRLRLKVINWAKASKNGHGESCERHCPGLPVEGTRLPCPNPPTSQSHRKLSWLSQPLVPQTAINEGIGLQCGLGLGTV